MKAKSPLLLVASFLLALLLAVSVYVYLNGLEQKGKKVTTFNIIVASTEIPQYTKITTDMIEQTKIMQLPADSASYYSKAEDLVGKYSGERILKGEQFFKSRILENAESNLALTLRGNHRAVSVMANLESGVAKLVKNGDYIDVLVSLPEIKEQDKVIRPDISKIILQKILVIAVDQKTSTASSTEGNVASSDSKTKSDSAVENVFYLTLSVPVLDVEKLALAENVGRLKFALRPKNDNTITPTDGAVWQELLAYSGAKTSKAVNPTTSAVPAKPAQTTALAKPLSASTIQIQYVYYVVKYGDTLMNIARTQLHDASQYKVLQQINNISDPSVIRPGSRIKIPVTQ